MLEKIIGYYNIGTDVYRGQYCGNTILCSIYYPEDVLGNDSIGPWIRDMSVVAGKLAAHFGCTNFPVYKYALNDIAIYKDYHFYKKSPLRMCNENGLVLFSVLCSLNFVIEFIENYFIEEIPQKFKYAYLQYYYLCRFIPESNREIGTSYRTYVNLKHEISIIDSFSNSWTEDLRELPSETEDSVKYRPREYFDDTFLKVMDEYALQILEECKYENLTSARFNLTDFDIEVNGGKKAANHGKGYCAFLNTVVALMFRKYFAEHSKYNPGILMIDTPLLGLDQGVDDAAPESMRTALFKYFMNNQGEGQTIIVENLEHIPDLKYSEAGANVITFTKGRFEGRYGFLEGIY